MKNAYDIVVVGSGIAGVVVDPHQSTDGQLVQAAPHRLGAGAQGIRERGRGHAVGKGGQQVRDAQRPGVQALQGALGAGPAGSPLSQVLQVKWRGHSEVGPQLEKPGQCGFFQ